MVWLQLHIVPRSSPNVLVGYQVLAIEALHVFCNALHTTATLSHPWGVLGRVLLPRISQMCSRGVHMERQPLNFSFWLPLAYVRRWQKCSEPREWTFSIHIYTYIHTLHIYIHTYIQTYVYNKYMCLAHISFFLSMMYK